MTSASELFNNRRSRFGRNPIEFGNFDSSSTASGDGLSHHDRRRNHHNHGDHHNHGEHRRRRHDDGNDTVRRTDNHTHRRSSLERESVRFDQGGSSGSSQSIPSNVGSDVFTFIPSHERFGRSNRLPGDVLLARERLLERLRGISSTGRRGEIRASSSIPVNDLTLRRNIRDSETWYMLTGLNISNRSNSDMGPSLASEATKYRPPGLTQDELDNLCIKVFTNAENGNEENISTASLECSICLDNFVEGAALVCLPCGHRYHQLCLYPWVRLCGDCPYCRAAIVVTSYKPTQ